MPTPEHPPRVAVAVAAAPLRRRVLELLEGRCVDTASFSDGNGQWNQLRRNEADMVVVDDSQVAAPSCPGTMRPPAASPSASSDARPPRLRPSWLRASSARGNGADPVPNGGELPELVVIGENVGATDRAHLLASGVAHILDASASRGELGTDLERLAMAAAAGGLDGPETGGNDVEPRLADFLSRSQRMRHFMETVRRVVDTDSSILISGETGVGKERLARAIHRESRRADGPFVWVNCGALPDNLLESELFGHVKGAYTGAHSERRGQFELADGGTIFLDEIGEMPRVLQVKLLGVIQRREIQRVGSEQSCKVDVRIMAATNRDLRRDVEDGRFRRDLYYRIHVMPLEMPSLRERREDIPDLVGTAMRHFRTRLRRDDVEGITEEALQVLLRYSYPGNVRELLNLVERAMLLCRGSRIESRDLLFDESTASPAGDGESRGANSARWLGTPLREARQEVVDEFERSYLTALLERTRGAIGETANQAGITPRALHEKMRRHGLRKEDFRRRS